MAQGLGRMIGGAVAAGLATAALGSVAVASTPPGGGAAPVAVEDAAVIGGEVLSAPGGELVWTMGFDIVVPESAQDVTIGDTPTAFIINGGGAVVSSGESRRYLTYPGAAVFPAGADVMVDAQPVTTADPVGGANYVSITARAEPGDADPVGDPFALDAGEYSFEVLYDRVAPGEATSIAGGDEAPLMVVVIQGQLTLDGVVLAPGGTATATGEAILTNDGEDDAVVFAARLHERLASSAGAATTNP